MFDRAQKGYLVSLMAAMLIGLAALIVHRDVLDPPRRPTALPDLAAWLREHPSDWQAAGLVTEQALDSDSPRRFELWQAAWQMSQRLAPLRPQTAISFVRSGFFHWYELSPQQRKQVLRVATPLLRDPAQFWPVHESVWQLTADMALLRRANPGTAAALQRLRDLAVTNGFFADYRELREEARKKALAEFTAALPELAPSEIVDRLPNDIDAHDQPMVQMALEELRSRPLDAKPNGTRLEALVRYAIDHNLEPLRGLELAVSEPGYLSEPLREELNARLNGDPLPAAPTSAEWRGLCGKHLCREATATRSFDAPGAVEIALSTAQTDEVAPYVELFIDDRLVAEGAVHETTTLRAPVDAGSHRLELRLRNPVTRNRVRRLVNIL